MNSLSAFWPKSDCFSFFSSSHLNTNLCEPHPSGSQSRVLSCAWCRKQCTICYFQSLHCWTSNCSVGIKMQRNRTHRRSRRDAYAAHEFHMTVSLFRPIRDLRQLLSALSPEWQVKEHPQSRTVFIHVSVLYLNKTEQKWENGTQASLPDAWWLSVSVVYHHRDWMKLSRSKVLSVDVDLELNMSVIQERHIGIVSTWILVSTLVLYLNKTLLSVTFMWCRASVGSLLSSIQRDVNWAVKLSSLGLSSFYILNCWGNILQVPELFGDYAVSNVAIIFWAF